MLLRNSVFLLLRACPPVSSGRAVADIPSKPLERQFPFSFSEAFLVRRSQVPR